jgi:integrase/recombinase XerD
MSGSDGLVFLPVEQWPDLDRRAWAQAHTPSDYFTKGGFAANWSPATSALCEREYGRLLRFQVRSGTLRKVHRVGQRIAREEDLRPFIDWLRTSFAPLSVVTGLRQISQAVRAMDPGADRTLINRAAAALGRRAKPVRRIDHRLISPSQLWHLGTTMMDEAETSCLSDKHRAVLHRDGLLIAFLALCPLRRKNTQGLRNEHHLDIVRGSNRLIIPAEEMKTRKRDFEVTLSEELVDRIRRHWTHYRPILAWRPGTDPTALWLTMRGTVMSYDTLYDRIRRILQERKGVQFSPHMFRHSAATFIAEVAPCQALIAVGVLGHTRFQTVRQHYIRGQGIKAFEMLQDEVAAIIARGENAPDQEP